MARPMLRGVHDGKLDFLLVKGREEALSAEDIQYLSNLSRRFFSEISRIAAQMTQDGDNIIKSEGPI